MSIILIRIPGRHSSRRFPAHTFSGSNRSFHFLDRRLLLRRTGMHDNKVRSRLRVHHGDFRPVLRVYETLGRVHDRPTLFTSHRRAHL